MTQSAPETPEDFARVEELGGEAMTADGEVHIYTAPKQPATRWVDSNLDPPRVIEWPAHRLVFAYCCGKRRLAKNCVVQSYYDGVYIWCAPERGCNAADR